MIPTHFVSTMTRALLLGAFAASCASTLTEVSDPEPAPEVAVVDVEADEDDEPMESTMPMTPHLTGDGVYYVLTDDPTRPLTRYADGQLSLSNSCGIRTENKLNRRIPPIYVNGQPVGFC